jgi:hypothetical protein
MVPPITKNFSKQIRAAVYNLWVQGEIWGSVDHAKELDHPLNPI